MADWEILSNSKKICHFAFEVHRKTALNVMFEGVYISTYFYFSREVIPCFWSKIGNGFLPRQLCWKG